MRNPFVGLTLIVVAIVLSTPLHAASQQFNVALESTDFLAEDSVGQFFYDVYTLIVTGPTPVKVSMTSPDFAPWVAVWDQELLPKFQWENGVDVYAEALHIEAADVNETAMFVFNALPFEVYQIAAATSQYNPTALGNYTLLIETPVLPPSPEYPDGVPGGVPFNAAVVVPVPASVWLLASAFGLISARRKLAG